MDKPSFFERLIGAVSESIQRRPRAFAGTERRRARQLTQLCQALLSERGEVSGARLAREALAAWQALDDQAKAGFIDVLAQEFSPDAETVRHFADAYRSSPTEENLVRLQRAIESPRLALFQRLNMAPGGTAQIIEMRRRVLAGLREKPEWVGVESDLARLLASWFNRGFLVLQRIDWRTSAIVLEKLIEYEAVHQIHGWHDLRRRLAADRRCYAFFHPALPDEPLIFIEVALTRGMSARVQPLLDPDSPVCEPEAANCAIFYSITNCQEGLRGVSFGNLLIKQVAEDLGREFPRIKTFATLSPIPGFRAWLDRISKNRAAGQPDRVEIEQVLAGLDSPDWASNDVLRDRLQPTLVRLCSRYLLLEKKGVEPLDAVARFHLGNGARLDRLNWLGDTSPAGMSRAAGLMVNYVYRLEEVERNHEAYAKEHRVIASRRLEALSKEPLIPRDKARRDEDPAHQAQYGHVEAVGIPPGSLPAVR
jgi:malonyl-CoA decarboxylase